MQLSYSVTRGAHVTARRAQICGRNTGPDRARQRGEWLRAPSAAAAGLGVLLDYAAGVIPADQIRAAGAVGSIRYVSDRRPGGAWMLGKPMQINEARDLHQNGLKIVSCYQYGKEASTDWLGGQSAGVQHATRGWQLHTAAGGPANVPIYASIDFEQYQAKVAPYLRGWESVVGHSGPACTATPRLSNGRCTTAWARTFGSTTGARRVARRILPPICIRSRSTSATSAASGWISTTSASRNSASGPELTRR